MTMRTISIALGSFVLGACAAAAVGTQAAPLPATSTAGVLHGDAAERRTSPNGTGTITMLARGSNAFLGKLEMAPGAAVPEHRDATEEYIVVLQGGGTITIDSKAQAVASGDTIYMPANALVSYQNGDTALVALQVFAGPEPARKYEAWTVASP
jgi:quercetin dioxygenase-like cupin family protein